MEFRSAKALFGASDRYLIVPVWAAGEEHDYPEVRAYDSAADRDRALLAFRSGAVWRMLGNGTDVDRGLPNTLGLGLSMYLSTIEYDEPEEQFRLFHNKQYAAGFIISNSETPGRHWHGSFGGVAERGVERLRRFRDNPSEWDEFNDGGLGNHTVNMGEEYIVPSVPVVEAAEPTDGEKLDALWDALFAEAKRRGWCGEFTTFAKKNGAPERFFKSKVKVTIEVEVDSNDPNNKDVRRAVAAAAETTTIIRSNWEVVSA